MKCVPIRLGKEILMSMHQGVCSAHIGARALAKKAVSQGFFWPSMIKDAREIVKTCEA